MLSSRRCANGGSTYLVVHSLSSPITRAFISSCRKWSRPRSNITTSPNCLASTILYSIRLVQLTLSWMHSRDGHLLQFNCFSSLCRNWISCVIFNKHLRMIPVFRSWYVTSTRILQYILSSASVRVICCSTVEFGWIKPTPKFLLYYWNSTPHPSVAI